MRNAAVETRMVDVSETRAASIEVRSAFFGGGPEPSLTGDSVLPTTKTAEVKPTVKILRLLT